MQTKVHLMRNDPVMNLKLQISNELEIDTADPDACIAFCEVNEPKLSICLALSQKKLEDLLETLGSHFQFRIDQLSSSGSESYQSGIKGVFWITKWIYATLACLHSPLEGSCLYNLRSIARICIQVRNSLKTRNESTSELVLPFNLIICLIALNFRQLDLLSL